MNKRHYQVTGPAIFSVGRTLLRPAGYAALPLACAITALSPAPGECVGMASVSATASPTVLIADGKSSTVIIASLRGTDGQALPDGTPVEITTTLGTLDHNSVTTVGGVARVHLTSSATEGTATVLLSFVAAGSGGAATTSIKVQFTSDHDLAASDGESRWIRIDCPEYLIYSADGHTVEAQGHHRSASLKVGALSVKADSFQYDLDQSLLLAKNALIKRGPYSIEVAEIRYDLYGNTGMAVLPATATQRAHSVSLNGLQFAQEPLSDAEIDDVVDNNRYRFLDLSASRVVMAAKTISIDPGNVIQFKRAVLYSDGKKVLSMPLHVMPLGTDQLFGEQIVGFSSGGLFLNIPYYYNLSPRSTGRIYLRNSATAMSGVQTGLAPTFGNNGSRPGLALDLEQTYTAGKDGNGSLILNGLTRSEWGGSWNHSQKIDSSTNAFLMVNSPTHRSLFGSSTLTRQFKGFSMNLNASADQDPGLGGYSYSSNIVSSYIQTAPKMLGRSGINSSFSFNVQRGSTRSTTPGVGTTTTSIATQGIDIRLNTTPMRPDKLTTINNSMTIGRSWSASSRSSSFTILGNVAADRQLPHKGRLNVNYNFTYDPLLSQLGSQGAGTASYSVLKPSALQQDLSTSCTIMPSKKLGLSFSTHYALPFHTTSFYTVANYQADPNWGFVATGYLSKYFGKSYTAMQLTVSRRIFNRSIQVTYDTSVHKFFFDFGAGQF